MFILRVQSSSASTGLSRSALIDGYRLSGDFGGTRPSGLTTLAFGRREPPHPASFVIAEQTIIIQGLHLVNNYDFPRRSGTRDTT